MSDTKETAPVILAQLEDIAGKGVDLYLDGREATARQIVDVCVREDVLYMPDYVIDDDGVLREVRYDKITKK